jgi:hypothetical protein
MLESNLSAATGHRPLGRPLWPAHFLCGLPNGWCQKAINSRLVSAQATFITAGDLSL